MNTQNQRSLEDLDKQGAQHLFDLSLECTKGSISFVQVLMRSLFLLYGGAVLVLSTFSGVVWKDNNAIALSLFNDLIWFIGALVLSIICFLTSYLTQDSIMARHSENAWDLIRQNPDLEKNGAINQAKEKRYFAISLFLFFISLAVFIYGIFEVKYTLKENQNTVIEKTNNN